MNTRFTLKIVVVLSIGVALALLVTKPPRETPQHLHGRATADRSATA